MKKFLIILAIIVAIVALSVFSVFSVQNKAISYEGQISIAESEIAVQEKRRSDLIPKLVECVKEYDEFEYNTLNAIIEMRGVNDESVSQIKTMVNAVAEEYPELKSATNYRELMNELSTTENIIAHTRTNYNTWANKYTIFARQFPNAQLLGLMGYDVKSYPNLEFEITYDPSASLFGE